MSDARTSPPQISRRDLFERVWSKPMTTNAAELGTTASALSALARRLGLPLPRAGHWMKKEVGKEPATPEYPADPGLDGKLYPLAAPHVRRPRPARPVEESAAQEDTESAGPAQPDRNDPEPKPRAEAAQEIEPDEHKKVASTRSAIRKSRSAERASVSGRGKFRLLVAPAAGERACAILDRLVAAVEARGWGLEDTEQGYAFLADGETVGFMIEEKLDRLPHVMTAAEAKELAEYERKCALADRGIGHRPWRPPAIPEHDYVLSGNLTVQFDHDYAARGIRRTFSDGKRQRLEDLVPSMLDSLGRWATAIKARREEHEKLKRDWDEQERRRRDRERQVRVEGYRIAFLQRQIERQRELDGLSGLIVRWEGTEDVDPGFAELLEFARLYRKWLEARIAPEAIARRITELKLMDEDVYIYDAKRLD